MRSTPPTAIICADATLGLVLVEVATRAGFEVTAVISRGVDAAVEAAHTFPSPTAVIIDLASAGMLGTEAVALVRRLSPTSAVIVLVPFPELAHRVAALGATAVLDENDLRRLPALLAQASAIRANGSESTNPHSTT